MSLDCYGFAIEELALSGAISLGQCSKSTVYRWTREINQRLRHAHANWHVQSDVENRTIFACIN